MALSHASLRRFRHASPMRIGILGGSFNPAHEGHIALSLHALKQLRLDYVWWLVSPANPFKSIESLAPFDTRLTYASDLVTHRHIIVSDYEATHGLRYTSETLSRLHGDFPQHHLVWLMGADNLMHLHRWDAYARIVTDTPIAIVDRSPCTYASLHSRFAVQHRRFRNHPAKLAVAKTPAWSFIFMPRHTQSATDLRKTLGAAAFSG